MMLPRFNKPLARPNVKFIGNNPMTNRRTEILALFDEGMNCAEAADALGISRSRLSLYMKDYGITRKK